MDLSKFVKNLADLFENADSEIINSATKFRNIEEWDSMHALTIMAMIDENYKIRITPEEMKRSVTIQDLFDLVVSKAKRNA